MRRPFLLHHLTQTDYIQHAVSLALLALLCSYQIKGTLYTICVCVCPCIYPFPIKISVYDNNKVASLDTSTHGGQYDNQHEYNGVMTVI